MPRKVKNLWLLISSLFFYGWGGVNFLGLMVVMIGAGFLWGLLVEKYREQAIGKWIVFVASGFFVLTLVYFKFAKVFPIGISFYTFQIMSYVIDVYRGDVSAQKSIINFAAYASMFPQLVAGPIVRYADVAAQLEKRFHSVELAGEGIRRFIFGLSKKVLIANTLGELCDIFRASGDKSVLFFWIYAVAFTLHIYFDFSGYSDMAVGLGKMFGFDFMENFNYPYISASITEFWRRWHISLSTWFRDYVYIPLGGNRVPKARWFFNIFTVWFLTGFWHGAAWNFIAWGLGFAVLLMIEKAWLLPIFEKTKGNIGVRVLRHIYVLVIVICSFVLFNATGLAAAGSDLAAMFGAGNYPLVSKEAVYYLNSYLLIFAVAIVGATPIPKFVMGKLIEGCRVKESKICGIVFEVLELVLYAVLLMVITAYLVDGSFNPFLYFRF